MAFAVDVSWVFNSAVGINQLDDFIAGFNQRSTTENVMAFAELGLAASTEKPVHGNSLSSQRPTWGYKLYAEDGTFLKNGITSRGNPRLRYTQKFLADKKLIPIQQFSNRRAAWEWEYWQNKMQRGPLNRNMH